MSWFSVPLLPMVTVLAGMAGGPVARAQSDTADPGTAPSGSVEVLARMEGPGPSGIAVTPEGRIFVGFPRHADDHASATLAELKGGRLFPYPSSAMSLPSDAPPAERLLSVHGMTVDRLGRLWIIDDGKRQGHDIPEGGAKVVGIDPRTNRVIASVPLKAPALRPDSHMNDLRVDLGHGAKGTAYVSDSSFGTTPALVVVDLASGRQRRVLANHPSTQPDPGFLTVLEGRALKYDPRHPTFPVGGVDGLALGEGGQRLYYAPLSSHRLYSVPTDVLANPAASDAQVAASVRDEGEKGAADGLAEDSQGRLYTTDFEHDAILRRAPDGTFERLAHDARFVWPDGIFVDAHHVYVTLGQWNRLPDFNGGKERRQPPYLLVRIPVEAPPTVRSPTG
ncbi:hypothetical protein OV208_20020 [Corallococcus sp. bb12-1]|uniref:L-dopachrome tautomerase-related protein n=1 Tax=Corallococcus sp. bb12-1 TaxID=2996784 RepID=UPI00227210C2|nr:L-dopachrome tautomerase-related protein [Corallococcus sp. bb12-1]MCY1043617.1 hypothetical protein [Corallococcus sp. bb12-1]